MFIPSQICAVIGLGNPGKEYQRTRHNIGFIIIDRFLENISGRISKKKKYFGDRNVVRVRGRNVFFLKPQTYMNLSGLSVANLCKKECLLPEQVLVVYDDMDLPLGKIRIRQDGGSSGHKGVESVIEELGSTKFIRLRVGIGRIISDGVADYVLSEFEEEEQKILEKVLDLSVAAIKLSLARDVQAAMNKYNGEIVKKTNNNGVKN